MSPGNVEETNLLRGDEPIELIRLRREVVELKARLAEEEAYYRAELEANRQRLERDSTRLQADEVGRRRRAEEQLQVLEAELRQAREQLDESELRNRGLRRQLAELEERQSEQQSAGEMRAAARTAWREAEQELARLERLLSSAQGELAAEQQVRQRLQAKATQQHAELQRARQAERNALRLVASLKKALWVTAQARRRAETKLATIDDDQPAADAQTPVVEIEQTAAPVFQSGAYNELSQETLQTVFFGDLSDELTDEFKLTTSDASLDAETVDQLRAITAAPAPEPDVDESIAAAPVVAPQPPSDAPLAATALPIVQAQPRSRFGLLAAGATGLAIALLYWLVTTSRFTPYLDALLEMLP